MGGGARGDGHSADARGRCRDAGPAGAQSGQKLRLRGRGLPGQPPGDEYVQLKVVLPPANSPEARSLYEDMRAKLAGFDPRADLGR